MSFTKDILLIDFETTHIDPEKAKPLQLAAVLLDRNDLKEKDCFSSYIKQNLSDARPQALEVNGITDEKLISAPDQNEVISQFVEKFGNNVLLASWVQYLDRTMLFNLLKDAGMDPNIYDYYHYLDLWPMGYVYLTRQGYSGGISSDEMFNAFGIPSREIHDALEDCRITAEILRKITH